MDKKMNKYIKKLVIEKNILEKTNKLIEEFCVNSTVIMFADYYTYFKNKNELEEIRARSLNHIKIILINENDIKNIDKIVDKFINETVCFLCGIGSFVALNFTKYMSNQLKIPCGLINLYCLKSEVFCDFSPTFIAINDYEYSKKEKFCSLCNISKYVYLFLENSFHSTENLLEFLVEYKRILGDLEREKILENLVKMGLILNKFKINFFIKDDFCDDFKKFIYCESLLLFYKNINANLRNFNLHKRKILGQKFEEIDFEFFENIGFENLKKYLISNKNTVNFEINNALKFLSYVKNKLKKLCFDEFVKRGEGQNEEKIFDTIKQNKNGIFLKKLENFEIFNFFS